jgi:hypothetical protein
MVYLFVGWTLSLPFKVAPVKSLHVSRKEFIMANTKKFLVSDEEFIEIVKKSFSIKEVISSCGLIPAGGNYQTTNKRIKLLGLDTSHFKGKTYNMGRKFPQFNVPIEDYLNNTKRINSHSLKLKLFSHGLKEKCCENCGLHTWQDKQIPLELHHVDGNSENNNLENILILCPNCHALTPNYRGKNISKS